MTLAEWRAILTADLQKAGFTVKEYKGFPLVERPTAMEDGVRLIKFRGSLPADRRIYGEGMIFLPAGSESILRERP